jgi:8-oxo-dGTP pyrophosphatase MutT (NUDIX family)
MRIIRRMLPPVMESLRRRLAGPLPGLSIHLALSPSHSRQARLRAAEQPAVPGAVALVLFEDPPGDWRLPLILRPDSAPTHAGQVAPPGGRAEPGEAPTQTALRELAEELGVAAESAIVLGALSPVYTVVSGFRIEPIVMYSRQRPVYRPDPREVVEVLEMPIETLPAPNAVRIETRRFPFGLSEVPYYPLGRHKVWGATAMMLAELAALWPAGPLARKV